MPAVRLATTVLDAQPLHGSTHRLCTGYAALRTSDAAAEDEDAAAEPGCAALARPSVGRSRLVDGPGCAAPALLSTGPDDSDAEFAAVVG